MRELVPYNFTAVVVATLGVAVIGFFSQYNISLSIADGEKAHWTKQLRRREITQGQDAKPSWF